MSLASVLAQDAIDVAPLLLGAVLSVDSSEGRVSLRLTEVEAYHGADDPGSHAFRGQTARNAAMFGEPGRLYTYFTYGMHTCVNVVCSPEGVASACLLRAGEVIEGIELARSRRPTARLDRDLARGPARLAVALGITLADGGASLETSRVRLALAGPPASFLTSPRTGVSGEGGGPEYPWRFWVPGEPSVSPYRANAGGGSRASAT